MKLTILHEKIVDDFSPLQHSETDQKREMLLFEVGFDVIKEMCAPLHNGSPCVDFTRKTFFYGF